MESSGLSDEGKSELMIHRWLQAAGTPDEHFDVTDDIRRRAIRAGAMPITARQAVLLRRQARGPPSVGAGSGGMTSVDFGCKACPEQVSSGRPKKRSEMR